MKLLKKMFILILVVSIISVIYLLVGNVSQKQSFDIVKDNVLVLDKVFLAQPTNIKLMQNGKVIKQSTYVPTKVIVTQNKGQYVDQKILYISPDNGIMGSALKVYREKYRNNVIPWYKFPVGVLKIVRDKIEKLDIKNPKLRNELLKKLNSIEEYIGQQQWEAMIPFVNPTAPPIVFINNNHPLKLYAYKGPLNKVIINIAFTNGKKFIGIFLDCVLKMDNMGEIYLSCQKKISNNTFKNGKPIFELNNKDWTTRTVYLYNYSK